MAIEIVDLPSNSMVIFHGYVSLPEGIVDLPIENDDFMGFWYGIYWVTLWLWRLQFAMVKRWP